ncbi:uncharacterized protein [Coffea arabica]|uniref:ATP-dependent DNA helicase n=1 Tax=Coffea arabica TaxID=13443 RepID=A0A6P6V8C8_COFAR
MSEDFMRNTELSAREIKRKVLEQINGFLQSMGKNIASFGLLPNNYSFSDVENQTRDVLAEKIIKVLEEDLNAISLLNQNQRQAFEVISKRVYENKNGAFFVDGPGETGKSFLYRALLADIRSKGYIALAIATSGIAASILFGGRTAHSRQTLPVVRKGSQSETIAASLINSPIWPALEKLELTQNMRARFDPSFADFLLRVGDGTDQAEGDSLIQLPSSILVSNGSRNASLHDLIDMVYPHIQHRSENPALPLNRAILITKNHFVDEVNDILIEKFPAVGDFAGKDVFIHRIPLQPPTDEQYPIPYIRTQFSIRLCFAMTINKAQGQTLDCVGIYLKEPVFSHGHLYVALSRARTASQVKVLIKPPFFDKPGTDQTKIIVFREVLETSRLAAK